MLASDQKLTAAVFESRHLDLPQKFVKQVSCSMTKKTSSFFDAIRLCTSFVPVVGPLTELLGGAYHEDRWMAAEGAVCLVADMLTSGLTSRAAKALKAAKEAQDAEKAVMAAKKAKQLADTCQVWRKCCRGTKLLRSIWKIYEKKQHNQESWCSILLSSYRFLIWAEPCQAGHGFFSALVDSRPYLKTLQSEQDKRAWRLGHDLAHEPSKDDIWYQLG